MTTPTDVNILTNPQITTFSAKYLFDLLSSTQHTPTLLLLSGGSFIEVCKELALLLTKQPLSLTKLRVSLIDERFVPVDHPDSNETQLRQSGLIDEIEKCGGKWESILTGISEVAEEKRVNRLFSNLIENAEVIIPIFGIGDDGHTAGILPQKSEEQFTKTFPKQNYCYYDVDESYPNPFKQRLTLTASAIQGLSATYLFAKGEKKKSVLKTLLHEETPIHQFPAKLLTSTNLTIFTDQFLT